MNFRSNESTGLADVAAAWRTMRSTVLRAFPAEPGPPADIEAYFAQVDANYVDDALNSLRIEGYDVTADLVERLAREDRDPYDEALGAEPHNVMAAFGYWRAHNVVKRSVRRVFAGENPGAVVREAHREWFHQLFSTSVDAGIVEVADLEVYRQHQAQIPGAQHVPPAAVDVPAMMASLFEQLEAEPSAAVRAVLGHFFFVFVHPFMDGTGRMGRFLMNVMLASGGYRWTVLRIERREEYLGALASASSGGDIEPFARFVASSLAR